MFEPFGNRYTIYVIQRPGLDEVKIGISSNLPKRLENLGAAHGVPLQVRVSFFGTVPMEEMLHGYFGGERMLREVFRLSPRLDDWIARQHAYLNPPAARRAS